MAKCWSAKENQSSKWPMVQKSLETPGLSCQMSWMRMSHDWEADSQCRCSSNSVLFCTKVHYSVYKSVPPLPAQSQMGLVHSFPPYLFKIHFSITLPSVLKNSKWPSSIRFSDSILCILTSTMCITGISHLSLTFIILTMLVKTYKLLNFSLCSIYYICLSSCLSGPEILPSTFFI